MSLVCWAALSGFLLIGGPAILSGLYEQWRMSWLLGNFQRLNEIRGNWNEWIMLYAAYFVGVIILTAWLILQARGKTSIYNVEEEDLELALRRALDDGGILWQRVGDRRLTLFGVSGADRTTSRSGSMQLDAKETAEGSSSETTGTPADPRRRFRPVLAAIPGSSSCGARMEQCRSRHSGRNRKSTGGAIAKVPIARQSSRRVVLYRRPDVAPVQFPDPGSADCFSLAETGILVLSVTARTSGNHVHHNALFVAAFARTRAANNFARRSSSVDQAPGSLTGRILAHPFMRAPQFWVPPGEAFKHSPMALASSRWAGAMMPPCFQRNPSRAVPNQRLSERTPSPRYRWPRPLPTVMPIPKPERTHDSVYSSLLVSTARRSSCVRL